MKMIKLFAVAATTLLAVGSTVGFAQSEQGPGAGQAHRPPPSKAHVLTRAELDKLLSEPDKVLLIDVRRPDEISTIGGFPVYLSIQLKDLKNSLAWIPHDRILVTVSNHAARAGRAADLLASSGFNVAGAVGAQLYAKEGGTLAKIAVPAPKQGASPPAQ